VNAKEKDKTINAQPMERVDSNLAICRITHAP